MVSFLVLAAICINMMDLAFVVGERSNFGKYFYTANLNAFVEGEFVTSKPFLLVYSDNANSVSWSMPPETLEYCGIESPSSPGDLKKRVGYNFPAYNESQCAFATCSKTGVFKFFVHRDNNLATKDVFYITVSDGQKYHWYMSVMGGVNGGLRSLVGNIGHSIKIWIIDYNLADPNELNGQATSPSKSSRQISYGLYEMGEAPSITLKMIMNIPLAVDTSNITFIASDGLWLLHLPPINEVSGTALFEISGKGINIFNRFSGSDRWYIDIVSNSAHSSPKISECQNVNSLDPHITMFKDYCHTGSLIALSPSHPNCFGMTSDRFISKTSLFKLSGYDYNNIRSVVYSRQTVVFLTDSGLFVLDRSFSRNFVPKGLPSNYELFVSKISSARYCDFIYDSSYDYNSFVFAWNSDPFSESELYNEKLYGNVYWSKDSGMSFEVLKVPFQIGSGYGAILDVAAEGSQNELVILIKDLENSTRIVIFDVISKSFLQEKTSLSLFSDPLKNTSIGHLLPSQSANGEMYIYGDYAYYSPNGGKQVLKISLRSLDPVNPAPGLASGEFVSSVSHHWSGNFALLTTRNRLFFGGFGSNEAIEILIGALESEVIYVDFDPFGKLSMYSVQNNSITLRKIDQDNVIRSPRPPLDYNEGFECPYQSFDHNLEPSYYLDVYDSILCNSTIFSEDKDIAFSNVFTKRGLLKVSTAIKSSYIAGSSLMAQTMQSISLSPSSYLESGKTDFRIIPTVSSPTCKDRVATSVITVGCPVGRHIRVAGTYGKPCGEDSKPRTIELRAGSYFTDYVKGIFGKQDKKVEYYCSKYGNPLSEYFSESFIPVVQLFDGNVFIKNVTADFVVWEDNMRSDFIYSGTLKTMNCLNRPYNWTRVLGSDFMSEAASSAISRWPISKSYSCYREYEKLSETDLNLSYEILNSSKINSLRWRTNYDSTYLFSLKVIDPEFSYCTLTTNFAVSVYGVPFSLEFQLGIIGAIVFSFILILYLSYFAHPSFRNNNKEKTQ